MLVGKAEGILRQLIFPAQRSLEHRGIVRIERDHHTLIEIIADWMLSNGLAHASAQVARDANLHRNLTGGKWLDQFGILRGGEPVTDPLGWEIQCAPN